MLCPDVEVALRLIRPEAEEAAVLKEGVETAEAEPEKDAGSEAAATFAGDQHVGAGSAFGIDQCPVLFDDQLPPQRDHEQYAQPAAEKRQREDACGLKIETKEHQRRKREDDAR